MRTISFHFFSFFYVKCVIHVCFSPPLMISSLFLFRGLEIGLFNATDVCISFMSDFLLVHTFQPIELLRSMRCGESGKRSSRWMIG